MENERIMDMTDAIIEETKGVVDAVEESAHDVAMVYMGAAALVAIAGTVAVELAWKYAGKPAVRKFKDWRRERKERKLEERIILTEDIDDKKTKKDEEEK